MTEHEPGSETGAQASTRPDDLERVVDDLEERVLGHRVDQVRHEDDAPDEPAFEQDLDTEDLDTGAPVTYPEAGPGAEPSS